MSVHLIECAAELKLKPQQKLVLLCFADSASRDTRVAYPGLDQLMTWSGLGRSRVFEVLKELTELGLIRQRASGHRGRRSEYLVFPDGCCVQHGYEPRPVDLTEGIDAGCAQSGTADPIDPPAESVDSPATRTLSHPQGPVDDKKGSGFSSEKGPALGWTPPRALLPTSTPVLGNEISEVANARATTDHDPELAAASDGDRPAARAGDRITHAGLAALRAVADRDTIASLYEEARIALITETGLPPSDGDVDARVVQLARTFGLLVATSAVPA